MTFAEVARLETRRLAAARATRNGLAIMSLRVSWLVRWMGRVNLLIQIVLDMDRMALWPSRERESVPIRPGGKKAKKAIGEKGFEG